MRTIIIVWAMLTACLFVLGQFKVQPLAEASVVLPDDATYQPIVVQVEEHAKPPPCPPEMVEIDGNYCPRDDARCLYWVDNYGKRTSVNTDRCGEWSNPVHCTTATVHKRFCIDRYEYPGEGQLPKDWLSFNEAEKIASANGKRLCTQSEWTMAALGPDNHQYPFGDGVHRDNSCNIDRHISEVGLTGDQVMKVSDPESDVAKKLRSQLIPSGSNPSCHSDYWVYDLSGNIDEVVINESGPYKSGLMSGHQYGVRNRSRAITTAHGPNFRWYEVGMRQCLDIR